RRAQLQCVQHFQPASVNLSAAGGVTDISIFSNDQCAWQATSDAPWISITGNVFGRGNGMVSIAGSTNFGGQSRRGFLALPNGSVEINQAPNLAPNVNAGADQTVTLPNTIALSGSVSDDGIGNKPTVSWSQVSGPGTVIFGGAAGLQSSAIFNQAGIYLLRLTATDGYLTSNDDIQITVSDDPTPPPPDPSTVAPILDTTITTNISKSSVFLYTGPNPIQTGVDPINIKPERVGLVRGKVLGRNAQPITNAIITIRNSDRQKAGPTACSTLS
ncbi:MAG TPA: PKD domain-containing protein, partial [Pyrinomonadaceae bacterium]|nr:PKD domain-containing protein [Pyrinomonadaceae bacterium]